MSLFSRLRSVVRSVFTPGSFQAEEAARDEIESEVFEEIGEDDALAEIWNNTVVDNIDDVDALRDFALDNNGAELFRIGWVDDGENAEERQAARDEFFDLMEAYDISRDEFDWDDWRDWYENA